LKTLTTDLGDEIMKKIEKVETCFLPTPLHKLENISKDLDGYNIYIKRDDMTGIGTGGNKLRKLDYIVKKALDEGYTTLLTYGGVQTNHGRLTAAAAARFGLKSVIMCYGLPPEKMSGNLVLDRIMGAEVVFMDTTDIREKAKDMEYEDIVKAYKTLKKTATDSVIKRYEDKGEKVAIVQIGGHSSEGLLGYFDCIKEIDDQLESQNLNIDYLVVGNGSGGTLGGLLLGKKYYDSKYEIYASNISPKKQIEMDELNDFCNKTSEQFEMGVTITHDDYEWTNDYTGISYNVPDEETRKVISYLASKEGIFVDPCYTGKSFMGLLGLIKEGKFKKNSNILFLHTGGVPGIWTEEHEEGFNNDLWNNIEVF